MKAVFDVKEGSGYDDDIARRYHFPARSNYLDAARTAVGDWVLFRESRRNGGRLAYIATARVESVDRDPDGPDHYYAHVSNYLEFPTPVPFRDKGRYAEEGLRGIPHSKWVGQALQGKSMRQISTEDFTKIVLAGLTNTLAQENAARLGLDFQSYSPTNYSTPGFAEDFERPVEQLLLNRKIRDANFRLEVCRAYNDCCAVTGLRIVNGGGRVEVQAAHIKPVSAGGPDIVRNGIALSATVHWLFDRHLISIDENYRLLVSHNRVPEKLRSLFQRADERLQLPRDQRLWPRPDFVAYHRAIYGEGH